jgi:hypothetical protein
MIRFCTCCSYRLKVELHTSEEQKLLYHFTDIPTGPFCGEWLQAAASLPAICVLHDGCGNSPVSHLWLQTPLEWRASWVSAGSSGGCAGGMFSLLLLVCCNGIQVLHLETKTLALHKSRFNCQSLYGLVLYSPASRSALYFSLNMKDILHLPFPFSLVVYFMTLFRYLDYIASMVRW